MSNNSFVVRNGIISKGDSVFSGSLNVTSGVTASLFGTSSYTEFALSSSFASSSATASFIENQSSFITTSSLGNSQTITGSLVISQSLIVLGNTLITSVTASSLNVGTNTISVFANSPAILQGGYKVVDSASLSTSSSLLYDISQSRWTIDKPLSGSFTGSLQGTAATASFVNNLSQSVKITGSVNITGSQTISGSVNITGSQIITGSVDITGSLSLNGVPVGSATVTISGSMPGVKSSGSLWWSSEDGNLYINVATPTGSTYVPATSTVSGGNYGATFRNTYSASVWTVNHNLNTTSPLINVYSGSQVMIPASIVSTSPNISTITFAGIVSGSVVASTGIGGPTSSSFALSSVSSVSASFATTASAFIGSQAEYLLAGKSTSQTFILGNNTINNFTTPTVNTLVTSSWNGTTGTFTAGRTATYRVGASFIVNQSVDGVGDFYSLAVLKNGSQAAEQLQMIYSTANTFKSNILIPILVPVVAGDILTFRWYQSINGNRTNTAAATQNYITIEELPTRIQI